MIRIEYKICKEKFEIDGILIGEKGDLLRITDAQPSANEDWEDVAGYCTIWNKTTDLTFDTIWNEIDDNAVLKNVN